MSIDNFIKRHWFALSLVSLHTLLVIAFAWIELDNAWNDMNPTMLVMAALHVGDYPVLHLLDALGFTVEQMGTYLVMLSITGGLFWFGIGLAIESICRAARGFFAPRKLASGGA